MEYYSALKRKEIPTHGTIGVNLEDIMLNEICQSHAQMLYDSTYTQYQLQSNSYAESRGVIVRDEVVGRMRSRLVDLDICKMKIFLEVGFTAMWMHLTLLC